MSHPRSQPGNASELLPCPLCRSSNVQAGVCYVEADIKMEPAVRCADCGCRATLKAWNTRPTPSDGAREALADNLRREVKVRRDHPSDYDEEITSWLEQAVVFLRSHAQCGVQNRDAGAREAIAQELCSQGGLKWRTCGAAARTRYFRIADAVLAIDKGPPHSQCELQKAVLQQITTELENLFAMVQGETSSLLENHFSFNAITEALENAKAALSLPEKAEGREPDFDAAARALGFIQLPDGKWRASTMSADRNTSQRWDSAEQIFVWWGRASGNVAPSTLSSAKREGPCPYAEDGMECLLETHSFGPCLCALSSTHRGSE